MSAELQALYNQTNILSWKTSYPACYVKDPLEPPLQSYSYLSKVFQSDKILKQYIHNRSNKYAWHISVSPDGMYIVILKNNNLELRSSKYDFNQMIFQCQIYKDIYPQWRSVCWSNCSSYFGVSFSNGMCNVWDLQGIKVSFNTNCVRSNDFDVITKMLIFEVSKAKIKLYVFTLNGKLILYNIHNFKVVNNSQSNTNFISTPILSCECSSNINMVVIGTYDQINNAHDNDAFKSGIILCRFIEEDPYVVSTASGEQSVTAKNSWFSFLSNKKPVDAVFMMRISKDDRKLVALHFSGKISIWNFPSLTLCFVWRSSAALTTKNITPDALRYNIFPNHYTDCSIVHIGWWNSEYITVALRNGRVLVLGMDQSVQSSNEHITLNPFPQIEESTEKTFFVLNCLSKVLKNSYIERKNDEIVERSSSWNFIATLWNYFLSDPQSLTLLNNPDFCSQNYTMTSFKLTTPEELFSIRINKKQYSEALLLATQYGLDLDLVFKKQWRDSNMSIDDVKKILIKIKKRNWILNECLEQIPNSIESMKFLLKLGFYLTDIDQWDNGDVELEEEMIESIGNEFRNSFISEDIIDKMQVDNLSMVQIEMIRIRMKLLNFHDKLTVYEQILELSNEKFKPDFYKELKSLSSFEIAIKFARNNNISGLRVLLDFYNSLLFKHILTILSNIPECVKPSTYRDIILNNLPPLSNNATSMSTKELDWCEFGKFSQIYNAEMALNEAEHVYYHNNPDHFTFILKGNGDSEQTVLNWCHTRVRKIEIETYNVANALEMLQIFKELDEEMDRNLEFNLRFLYEAVYNCQITNAFLSLSDFEMMTDLEKANLLMSRTSTDRFLFSFNHWIMPLVEEIDCHSKDRSLAFFRDYLVNLGSKNLCCARKLLEDSETMDQLMKIVNFRDIVNGYITVMCNDDEVCNVGECVLISKTLVSLVPNDYVSELKQIQEIDNYVAVLKILEKYELKKTIKFVHDNKMNGELVENLITNMVYHYLKGVKQINKIVIKSVFTEIQIALSLVFKSVHPTLIYKNLLKSLLESGDKKKINLASEFMVLSTNLSPIDDVEYEEKLIDFPEAAQCILVAVKNYINMSTSSKDANITLAKYCLDLVVNQTKEIVAEREIIQCSEFLDKWRCSLVPIEIRSVVNRFELLTNCLERNKNLYREMEEVIEAGTVFYVDKTSDRKFREGEALRLIAQKAYSNNDRESLEIAMSSLLHRDHKPCWKECVMALKLFDYPIEKKCELGSYAVTNCPATVLTETVRFVNEIQLATLNQSDSTSKDSSQSSVNSNSNSNLIVQPIKYLSSKISLKSIIDRSTDTLSKISTQVTQIGSRGSHELFQKSENLLLTAMSVDLIYGRHGRLYLKSENERYPYDIARTLTSSLMIDKDQSVIESDQIKLKLVELNINRDTYLAINHAMAITDLNLVYNLRTELVANTYSRALVYTMVALNLVLKYSRSMSLLNQINTDEIEHTLAPLRDKMSDNERSILDSASQEFKDYFLIDGVKAVFPSICMTKFFSSVDYRRDTIFQLAQFSDDVQLFPYAVQLAERYNVEHYDVTWTYIETFIANSRNEFDGNYICLTKVFNLKQFLEMYALKFTTDLEKHLLTNSVDRIAEFQVVLKLLPNPCNDVLIFKKSIDNHRRLIILFESIFTGSNQCDYLDFCVENKVTIINCLKQVINSDNADSCAELMTAFNFADEFAAIKNDFSFVLANQMLWSKVIGENSSNDRSEFMVRFERSLKNFNVMDYDNCKEFIFGALFNKTEIYLSPELKIDILNYSSQFIDGIVNEEDDISVKWCAVGLEVTIWLDHVKNTVMKVADKLRQLSTVSDKIVTTAEYMPPENFWQCLLSEMLLEGVSYEDLFTLTWDLGIDSSIIDESILTQISYLCFSKFLPLDAIVEKLSHILGELDDYMDNGNVQGILEQILDKVKDSKEQIHRLLLDELVFRTRKNKSKSNVPINKHIIIILKSWGLPVNDKITFQKNNLHLIDGLMQDCDSPEKMRLIPRVIELVELVEEDNNLWQCWIKACVIKGVGFCSFVFEQFENLKTNKLYKDRIGKLAKDAIQSLSAFNSAEAISLLILMDPIEAADQVNAILTSLKSDPVEYTNTMKNINTKALQMIVDGKLMPLYAKTALFQRLVNFLTKEINDSYLTQEVLEQLKDNGLVDEATWLTSSSSHINPAMKTIEMVSGFWKRFSNN